MKDETTLERAFNAGGMPAKANGAITREGSNGSANKNVARACWEEGVKLQVSVEEFKSFN